LHKCGTLIFWGIDIWGIYNGGIYKEFIMGEFIMGEFIMGEFIMGRLGDLTFVFFFFRLTFFFFWGGTTALFMTCIFPKKNFRLMNNFLYFFIFVFVISSFSDMIFIEFYYIKGFHTNFSLFNLRMYTCT
jgi:hypothetical protein